MVNPRSRNGAIVVTGASAGFGAGFARRFAARGHDLVLVARRRDRLEMLADEMRSTRDVRVAVVPADLTEADAPSIVAEGVEKAGAEVTGLVNCAGFGTAGPFVDESPRRIADEIAVNVSALTALTRLFLPRLIAARGLLVQVSSNASHQPLPGIAVYAATKAYVTSLTEAIWQETRGTGLRVLALCPGPTETEFFQAAGSEAFKVGAVATVDQVLDATFRAFDRRDLGPVLTVGAVNTIQGTLARIAPRRLRLAVAASLMEGER